MATILEFRRIEDAAAPIRKPVEGSLGEIIIFPGVRIERHTPSHAPGTAGPTNRRRVPRVRKKSRA
jgi:hypothetical protein